MSETTTPAAVAPPLERLQEALGQLQGASKHRRRWLTALRALNVIRDAAGDLLLELIEDWGATEEEAIDSIAAALDDAFKLDANPEAGAVLRFLEAKDHAFWVGRLRRWAQRARDRQAAAAEAAAT